MKGRIYRVLGKHLNDDAPVLEVGDGKENEGGEVGRDSAGAVSKAA